MGGGGEDGIWEGGDSDRDGSNNDERG